MEAPVKPESRARLSPSDAELVAAINSGDSDSFEVLYRRHRDWVVALAFRFTGNEDTALDVLQEVFIYLLSKFPGLRLTAQFKTFLYPAVRNLSIAARRKAARYQTDPIDMDLMEAATPAADASSVGDLEFVLASLPAEQREVLLLRFVEGFTLAEMAQAMQIPIGTAKSRLHNALRNLRLNQRTKSLFED